MKKWEEERKKKLYNNKIKNTKGTLKTQPKGSKVPNRTPNMGSHYGLDDEAYQY